MVMVLTACLPDRLARGLLWIAPVTSVDRGVIASAAELLEARHYPGVVAMCSDALDGEPECLPLLLIRARAHVALRRDLDAQADLRDIIRLDPQCGAAYRLLGELAARRDQHGPAATFFREAIRLDPGDREAHDWLLVVDVGSRPAAVAQKLPATATAAGRSSRVVRSEQPRLARGTQAPDPRDERPTRPFGCATDREHLAPATRASTRPPTPEVAPQSTLKGRPPLQPPAKHAPRLTPRPVVPTPASELPGFGEYLVATGVLSRERLRAAQAYQRSMRVQLSTAIVTLGLASPQRIEWAAVAHQSQLAGERPLR